VGAALGSLSARHQPVAKQNSWLTNIPSVLPFFSSAHKPDDFGKTKELLHLYQGTGHVCGNCLHATLSPQLLKV
jgi:hypothetical protein